MNSRKLWVIVGTVSVLAVAVVASFAVWEREECKSSASAPAYSHDQRFYSQLEFDVCKDPNRSGARLLMGRAGSTERQVILRFGPLPGEGVSWKWHEGPELHVKVAAASILERPGLPEGLPLVIVTEP